MGKLDVYQEKRDFRKTSEPKESKPSKSGRAYLIQKHDATRLHYDFRLEHDGVLLSWAIPKGPSLDPSDKRLAVRTEDHPVSYGSFEGVIPEHEYGGGPVMLWDAGEWEPEGDVGKGLKDGELKFTVNGERLNGGWALVRMNTEKGKENWLLIKEKDDAADPSRNLTEEYQISVKSGRAMEAIEAGEEGGPKERGKRPKFGEPQLATLVDDVPEGEDWLHELKYDGYRTICAIGKGGPKFYTRSGKDWTEKFSSLIPSAERLDVKSALIDGEIAVAEKSGKTDFKALQSSLKDGSRPLSYFVFDLLELDGDSLRNQPLSKRKEKLRELFGEEGQLGSLYYSDHQSGDGEDFYRHACEAGLEGIICKKADSTYRSTRTKTWLKVKCGQRQEFVIAGYTPSDKKGRGIASLLLGVYDGDDLIYAGRVGAGFTEDQTVELKDRLDALSRKTSPYKETPSDIAKDAVWATPKMVGEVEFTEWTTEGRLRHPAFQGLRGDKDAKKVVDERKRANAESPAPSKGSGKASSSSASSSKKKGDAMEIEGVRLTHPDKVLYADQGVTKQDLTDYYLAVKDWVLPHLEDRPISLVRCPDGQGGECFFQRHAGRGLPDSIRSVTLKEKEGKGEYILLDGIAGVIGAVQMGGLELHPWGAKIDDIDKPDRMIFDLDPDEDLDFEDVKEAADHVRGVLEAAELESFLKTTGGKGLHVVVPLMRRQSWDEVKRFSHAVAEKLEEAEPKRYVANMAKAKRKGRIFVDYLRNDRGNTAVAAYSTRAKAGATVSCPLRWDELSGLEGPKAYDISNVPQRLEQLQSDPWDGFFEVRQSITRAAMKAFGVTG